MKSKTILFVLLTITTLLHLLLLAAKAQSTDRDNPTPLTINEVKQAS